MLTICGLNQFHGASHCLRDVDLTVDDGRIHCLMGRNGVGKTSLLNAVIGQLPARSGALTLDGKSLDRMPTEDRVKAGIGYVPQGRMIFPQLTVLENLHVALAGRGAGGSRPRRNQVPELVYEFFPILRDMAARRGGDLSGGQQQQLAIGRALVLEPRVLLLDEPCEGIQPNIVELIGQVLQTLRDQGMAILLVEQKLPFARTVADEFSLMDRGSIVASGPIDALTDFVVEEHLNV